MYNTYGLHRKCNQLFLFQKIYFTAHICCMWTHNKYRAWVISCFFRIRWCQANFPSKNTIVKSALLKVFDLYLLRYFWGSWPISWEPWFSTSSESESQRDMTVALQCLKDAVCWLIRLPLIHRSLSRRQRPLRQTRAGQTLTARDQDHTPQTYTNASPLHAETLSPTTHCCLHIVAKRRSISTCTLDHSVSHLKWLNQKE